MFNQPFSQGAAFFIYKTFKYTDMNKEMNGDAFVPTREIREYDRKLREKCQTEGTVETRNG